MGVVFTSFVSSKESSIRGIEQKDIKPGVWTLVLVAHLRQQSKFVIIIAA